MIHQTFLYCLSTLAISLSGLTECQKNLQTITTNYEREWLKSTIFYKDSESLGILKKKHRKVLCHKLHPRESSLIKKFIDLLDEKIIPHTKIIQ
jgi:hypothetical protein